MGPSPGFSRLVMTGRCSKDRDRCLGGLPSIYTPSLPVSPCLSHLGLCLGPSWPQVPKRENGPRVTPMSHKRTRGGDVTRWCPVQMFEVNRRFGPIGSGFQPNFERPTVDFAQSTESAFKALKPHFSMTQKANRNDACEPMPAVPCMPLSTAQ